MQTEECWREPALPNVYTYYYWENSENYGTKMDKLTKWKKVSYKRQTHSFKEFDIGQRWHQWKGCPMKGTVTLFHYTDKWGWSPTSQPVIMSLTTFDVSLLTTFNHIIPPFPLAPKWAGSSHIQSLCKGIHSSAPYLTNIKALT